jgi:glycosyltransferase involved in cell wall biosynthesis
MMTTAVVHGTPRKPKAIKVLHLISSRGLYGAERVALELCKSLKGFPCEAVIGVIKNSHNPHDEIAEEAKSSSIRTVIFPCESQFDRKTITSIRDYIDKNSIDILNSHGYKSNFYGFIASHSKIPIVATNHNWLTSHWRLKIYCLLDSLWIRYFDRIVAVSEGVKEQMLKYKIPNSKIRVIDNGVDISRFEGELESTAIIRKELGLCDETLIIGTVGSLTYEKGQRYLLQAAPAILRKYENALILFVGDGPLREELKRESIRLGITDHVIFTGYRKDVQRLLSIMNIFVLPSVIEGLPMVILEAMASHIPVIASRVGAIPKVIDGNNGLLIEPGDVHCLQTAIIDLLNDDSKRKAIADAGYTTVRSRFSAENMSSKYFNLYQEVLA